MELRDRVIVITGASAGIGAALARDVAGRGARVVLAARRTDRIEQLAAELPDALAVTTDVTRPADLQRLVDATLHRYDRLDVLVNNAGRGMVASIDALDLARVRELVELNVYGPLRAIQAVLPVMRRQGSGAIVNVSSGTMLSPAPTLGGYRMTKAALDSISQTLRAEVQADGIHVLAVWPTLTDTEFFENLADGSFTSTRALHPPEYAARQIADALERGDTEAILDRSALAPSS